MPDELAVEQISHTSNINHALGWRGGTLYALRYRNYQILFVTSLMAAGGGWFQQVTIGWPTA